MASTLSLEDRQRFAGECQLTLELTLELLDVRKSLRARSSNG